MLRIIRRADGNPFTLRLQLRHRLLAEGGQLCHAHDLVACLHELQRCLGAGPCRGAFRGIEPFPRHLQLVGCPAGSPEDLHTRSESFQDPQPIMLKPAQ